MAKKTKATAAETGASAATGALETPRMLEHYLKTVQPALSKALDRTNAHAIPRLEKIVVNMGVGIAVTDATPPERSRDRPIAPRLASAAESGLTAELVPGSNVVDLELPER